jgi:hypothetical protein
MSTPSHLTTLLSTLHATHPHPVSQLLLGLTLLLILTSLTRPPPSSNTYPLLLTLPSIGPGPLRRPCPICFTRISSRSPSIKHKPCRRAYHLNCYEECIDANIQNLKTPLCPLCLDALLTYEQTVQVYLWGLGRRMNRLFWRVYLNAVSCGDWLALGVAAGVFGVVALMLLVAQGLGRYRRWVLLRLGWVVGGTLG